MISDNSRFKVLLHESTESFLTIHEVRTNLEKCLDQAKKVKSLMEDNDIKSPYDLNSVIDTLEMLTKSMWTGAPYF